MLTAVNSGAARRASNENGSSGAGEVTTNRQHVRSASCFLDTRRRALPGVRIPAHAPAPACAASLGQRLPLGASLPLYRSRLRLGGRGRARAGWPGVGDGTDLAWPAGVAARRCRTGHGRHDARAALHAREAVGQACSGIGFRGGGVGQWRRDVPGGAGPALRGQRIAARRSARRQELHATDLAAQLRLGRARPHALPRQRRTRAQSDAVAAARSGAAHQRDGRVRMDQGACGDLADRHPVHRRSPRVQAANPGHGIRRCVVLRHKGELSSRARRVRGAVRSPGPGRQDLFGDGAVRLQQRLGARRARRTRVARPCPPGARAGELVDRRHCARRAGVAATARLRGRA